MLHSINKEQRLYVLKCGGGFTCNGFDYIEGQARKVLGWLHLANGARQVLEEKGLNIEILTIPVRKGTKKHYNTCRAIIDAGAQYATLSGNRCGFNLSEQLAPYHGRRVEVVDQEGETRRFIVGKSAGWMPCHLEISRKNSHGGTSADSRGYKSVRLV